MGIGTPFHSRTSALCRSFLWREWAGYFSVTSYETRHDREYFAIRHSAGLLDVSPLYKYLVSGRDALTLVNRIVTRNMERCAVGQVVYTAWCDGQGKVIDDGNVSRLGENTFRVTSVNPGLKWFQGIGRGLEVEIQDETADLGALALQGPTSRDILKAVSDGDLDDLGFFRLTTCRVDAVPVTITRTGYTGDLGYELWVPARKAVKVWDALMEGGKDFGITPAGLNALDLARIEAGFVLIDVDYVSARKA